MQTVEDESGRRYLLEKRSGETSRVRDPATGERRHVATEALTPVEESPLGAAAAAVPEPIRRVLTAVPDERALGLLLELGAREPATPRTLLEAYDLCESDLLGLLAEFRTAGLIEETTVGGEQGYALTEQGEAGIDALAG